MRAVDYSLIFPGEFPAPAVAADPLMPIVFDDQRSFHGVVAHYRGELIGWLSYSPRRVRGSQQLLVHVVWVALLHRRRGLARTMLHLAIDDVKPSQLLTQVISLAGYRFFQTARAVWPNLNFRVSGAERFRYEIWNRALSIMC